MQFTLAEPGIACWRLAYTFSDFYPPDESVQSCLDGLDQTDEAARQHEKWYHTRKCEVYQAVIEHLYDDGVDVWAEGQSHVQNGSHPDSAKPVLTLPGRPPTIDAIPSDSTAETPEDGLQNALSFVKEQVLSASHIDEQLMWTDVLSGLTNTRHSDIHAWLEDSGQQADTRRDA